MLEVAAPMQAVVIQIAVKPFAERRIGELQRKYVIAVVGGILKICSKLIAAEIPRDRGKIHIDRGEVVLNAAHCHHFLSCRP